MWVLNTPSQVANELACWFVTVHATVRCRWADGLMVLCRVVFAGIVGSIEKTFSPKIFELALCVAAF